MSAEIVPAPTSNLVIAPDQKTFSPQQLAALEAVGVEGASQGEIALFFHQCVRTGLDPFVRQIYMVGRKDNRKGRVVYTIQTGIDGYRLIADRTGRHLGTAKAVFERKVHPVTGQEDTLCVVAVHKNVGGTVADYSGEAWYSEYVQTNFNGQPAQMWAKMPAVMLAKCAEAIALRRAFPQDLSGIYTSEEMDQAGSERPMVQAAQRPELAVSHDVDPDADYTDAPAKPRMSITQEAQRAMDVSPAQVTKIQILRKENPKLADSDENYRKALSFYGVTSSKDLTTEQASAFIDQLEAAAAKRAAEAEQVEDAEVVEVEVTAEPEAAAAPEVAENPFD